MDTLEITRPDDWHLHLRDGEMLARVLPHTTRCFARAIVMPNLTPPVTTVGDALAYRDRILEALPREHDFEPLMTLYLTDQTAVDEIARAADEPAVHAVKLYPQGATTNSEAGVSEIASLEPVLEAMEAHDLPLLVHGEVTRASSDVFDRERLFLEEALIPITQRFEGLRVVFEHITTKEAAEFVAEAPARIAATITPQHLLLNRNALFEGGLRPHHYCLPVLKRERDRQALVAAATSGNPAFFLGTDSAPHTRGRKESECGCAGIFSAPIAIELYAEAFARAGALDRLEAFASHHGADFYRLPRNAGRIRLERQRLEVKVEADDGPDALVHFWSGGSLEYRLV